MTTPQQLGTLEMHYWDADLGPRVQLVIVYKVGDNGHQQSVTWPSMSAKTHYAAELGFAYCDAARP